MQTFNCLLITPSALLYEASVVKSLLPTTEGEIGILPIHANLVTSIGVGILKVYTNSIEKEDKTWLVSGGLAIFKSESLTLMCDKALVLEGYERDLFKEQYELLEKELATVSPEDTERYNEIKSKLNEAVALAFKLN
jgi:F-type H+-transporting ATPase subunit epsilon